MIGSLRKREGIQGLPDVLECETYAPLTCQQAQKKQMDRGEGTFH